MKKIFFALALSVFTVMAVSAQEPVTLKLKSGVSVTGTVIEEGAESMKIQTAEGDIFIYRTNEIDRIVGNNGQSITQEKKERDTRGLGNFKGYRSVIELSGGAAIGNSWACNRLQFSYIGGYNFGSYLYAGLGVGLALTDMCCDMAVDVPVFLHVRSAFLKNRKVSPYISLNLGYNIGVSASESYVFSSSAEYIKYSSFYAEPTVGVEIRLKKKSAVSIGLTLPLMPSKIYASSYIYNDYYSSDETYPKYIGVGGKVAFSF